jgi:hypothetical protein
MNHDWYRKCCAAVVVVVDCEELVSCTRSLSSIFLAQYISKFSRNHTIESLNVQRQSSFKLQSRMATMHSMLLSLTRRIGAKANCEGQRAFLERTISISLEDFHSLSVQNEQNENAFYPEHSVAVYRCKSDSRPTASCCWTRCKCHLSWHDDVVDQGLWYPSGIQTWRSNTGHYVPLRSCQSQWLAQRVLVARISSVWVQWIFARSSYGQLTDAGIAQHYRLGGFIRQRYNSLLNSTYIASEIQIRSTDFDRTLMSAQSNLAGLYPTPNTTENKIPIQPIPIHTVPTSQDFVRALDCQDTWKDR